MLFEISFTPITNNDGQSIFRRNVVLKIERTRDRELETKVERGETERERGETQRDRERGDT